MHRMLLVGNVGHVHEACTQRSTQGWMTATRCGLFQERVQAPGRDEAARRHKKLRAAHTVLSTHPFIRRFPNLSQPRARRLLRAAIRSPTRRRVHEGGSHSVTGCLFIWTRPPETEARHAL